MPIRINLLAEAQALEELRRRDPLKRVVFAGVCLVLLVLVWSSSLLVQTMMARGEVTRLEGSVNSRTNEYRQILDSQRRLDDGKRKLAALHELAANRFLAGNLLDALQQVTVDDVQLIRLKVDQSYLVTPEVKPSTIGETQVPGKPATSTEKIVITLNARDNSQKPGEAINRFQEVVSRAPFFQEALGRTNVPRLASRGTPQTDADGKTFLLFDIECRLPEKLR